MSEFDEGFVFDGNDGLSCEVFVRLVRQYAFSKDRGKDDEWIAQFAATRMEGAAIRWLEDQTEETQDSWKLLRRAIFVRWPAMNAGAQSPLSVSSNAPTPAAAPPRAALAPFVSPAVQPSLAPVPSYFVKTNVKGRIRILSTSGVLLGYVAFGYSKWGHHFVTRNTAEAVHAEFRPSSDFHEIRLLNTEASSEYAFLGLTWDSRSLKSRDQVVSALKEGTNIWGGVATVTTVPQFRSTSRHNAGCSCTEFWSVLSDGSVVTGYEIAAQTYVRLSLAVGNVTGSLTLTNNYPEYASEDPGASVQGTLEFEPM